MIGIGIRIGIIKTSNPVLVVVATSATGVGETSFTANWNLYSGAQYYLLDVSTSSSFSSFILQNQVVSTNSYLVTGLTANTTYYYRVRASTDPDPDAAAFFARVSTAGGTLTTTEKNAVNQLVLDMKSYGIWASMKAIYPMVGASAAACAQNLKSSSFTGTFTSGWTFASTGVTPNGTSAYMDTFFNPNTNLTISSASLSVYTRTSGIGGSGFPIDLGCDVTGTGFNISQKMSGAGSTQYHGRAFVQTIDGVDGNNIAGLQLISRNSTTSLKYFRNGTLIQTNSTLEVGPIPNINAYLGALNNNGSPSIYSNREYAFASLSDGLTDTQASNFYTAVQAFQTTLSRQV